MSSSSCCSKENKNSKKPHNHKSKAKRDYILLGSALVLLITIGLSNTLPAFDIQTPMPLHHFAHTALQILFTMWWGVALGIVLVGMMNKVPRSIFTKIMGQGNNFSGLLRAVFGGLFLDLCCHGILLVAAKLYERGVSLAQVVTFLVASPWNSVSLTLILITLIGLKWTLLYILGSVIIALFTGLILQKLTAIGMFPENPNKPEIDNGKTLKQEFKTFFSSVTFSFKGFLNIIISGWKDGKMIIKWLLFGTIIAASLRTFIPSEMFAEWLGPTLTGLFVTLIIATIVEICSEGSAPIASEIVTSAHAPGNGFTFLMAGVATDYTEIMAIKEFTGSWKIALAIPIITVPQVLLIGYIMNIAG